MNRAAPPASDHRPRHAIATSVASPRHAAPQGSGPRSGDGRGLWDTLASHRAPHCRRAPGRSPGGRVAPVAGHDVHDDVDDAATHHDDGTSSPLAPSPRCKRGRRDFPREICARALRWLGRHDRSALPRRANRQGVLGDDVRVARQPDSGEPAQHRVGTLAILGEHVGVDDGHARAGELVLGGRADRRSGLAVALEWMVTMVMRLARKGGYRDRGNRLVRAADRPAMDQLLWRSPPPPRG